MENIGTNHGSESLRIRLHTMDDAVPNAFAIDNVLGVPGRKYSNSAPRVAVEGTLQKLIANSNELAGMNLANRLAALEDAVARGPFG